MNSDNAMWPRQAMYDDWDPCAAGAIIRATRLAQGLTLAQFGARCGYSASQVSRYERGIQPLTDIRVLRRFAEALAIPPQLFGLLPLCNLPREGKDVAAGRVADATGSARLGWAAAYGVRTVTARNYRYTAFGPTNVALYQISIAQVLGDNGTAIQLAATVDPAGIPTAERRGRFWVDVARAYHQWGKPEQCYRALLSAERAAPAEVRYRPPVHRMTLDLLRADRHQALPGLRAFATRTGAAALT